MNYLATIFPGKSSYIFHMMAGSGSKEAFSDLFGINNSSMTNDEPMVSSEPGLVDRGKSPFSSTFSLSTDDPISSSWFANNSGDSPLGVSHSVNDLLSNYSHCVEFDDFTNETHVDQGCFSSVFGSIQPTTPVS